MNNDHRKDGTFRKGNTARQVGDASADGHLHIRVPMETKGRWVQASRTVAGRGLSAWVIQTLDAAAAAELQDNREVQP